MTSHRLEFIDFAKGFAILAILVFHYLIPFTDGVFGKIILVGGSGVHLFFLLSGYGLGLSKRGLSVFEFYKKRFIKILIPYYIVIIIIFLLNLRYDIYSHNHELYALAGHIFLFKMFDSTIMESFGPHLWFISTIIQFYIIFPLFSELRKKLKTIHFLLFTFFLSCLYWIVTAWLGVSNERVFNGFFLQYLWEFSLGYILAERFKNNDYMFWVMPPLALILIALVGYFVMGMMTFLGGDLGRIFNDVPSLVGITASACFFYALSHKSKLLFGFVTFIGRISFEIYLTHLIIFAFFLSHYINALSFLTKASVIFCSLTLTIVLSYFLSKFNNALFKFLNS